MSKTYCKDIGLCELSLTNRCPYKGEIPRDGCNAAFGGMSNFGECPACGGETIRELVVGENIFICLNIECAAVSDKNKAVIHGIRAYIDLH